MRENPIEIECKGKTIPCSLYRVDEPKGIALLGHGLGVDRFDTTVLAPTRILNELGIHVIVPELPLHGDRQDKQLEWDEIVEQWQSYWANDGRNLLLDEWQHIYAYTQQRFSLPIVYFGLSLGTQYGVLFLSNVTGVRGAVLGLFGSEPPPKSIVMNHCAPRVTVPTYFIQKMNDEIHSATATQHLYESLGSPSKILDSSLGQHKDVGADSIMKACDFLRKNLD